MEVFIGIVSVVLVGGITIRLATKYQDIALALVIGFILRVSTALINLYVVTLPDGGIDATGFVIKSKRKYLNNALVINMFHIIACWLWILAI